LSDGRGSFTWLFDEGGQVAPGSFIPNNKYREYAGQIDPEAYLPAPLEEILGRHSGGERTDADD
jgi:hypothetical protein